MSQFNCRWSKDPILHEIVSSLFSLFLFKSSPQPSMINMSLGPLESCFTPWRYRRVDASASDLHAPMVIWACTGIPGTDARVSSGLWNACISLTATATATISTYMFGWWESSSGGCPPNQRIHKPKPPHSIPSIFSIYPQFPWLIIHFFPLSLFL